MAKIKRHLSPGALRLMQDLFLLAGYWLAFAVFPLEKLRYMDDCYRKDQPIANLLMLLLLISPLFFFIPYKMANFANKQEKIAFIVLGITLFSIIFCFAFIVFDFRCAPILPWQEGFSLTQVRK